jgi:hypothetical protein
MGRLGPTNVKPVPEADACEMVMLEPVVFVTTHGRIMLLPTCTLPKLILVVYEAVWLARAWEVRNRKTSMTVQQAGLRGGPRQVMVVRSLYVRAQ